MTGVPGYKRSLYVLEYRKPWWILNSKKKGVLDLVGNEELQQKFMIYLGEAKNYFLSPGNRI